MRRYWLNGAFYSQRMKGMYGEQTHLFPGCFGKPHTKYISQN